MPVLLALWARSSRRRGKVRRTAWATGVVAGVLLLVPAVVKVRLADALVKVGQ